MTETADDHEELRFAPIGDLDLVAGESLEVEVRRRMSEQTERVVVDLRRVDLLDSTGLRVLITLRNEVRRNGRRLALVDGPPAVQRVFQLTATRGLFDWLEAPGLPGGVRVAVTRDGSADPDTRPREVRDRRPR